MREAGCSDKTYRVEITMPFVYVVKAESEEAARRLGIEKWRDRIPAEVGMFPEDVTVEELVAPATEAVK